jgi:hypothetical protein
MGLFSWLRRSPKPATTFIYVYLPEPIDTEERESKYRAPLTIELQLAGVGFVSGGGALEEEASGRIIHAAIDIEAHDRDAARALLRAHLPDLGCPPGTRLEWFDVTEWQDLFTGAGWEEAQPMTPYAERDGYA